MCQSPPMQIIVLSFFCLATNSSRLYLIMVLRLLLLITLTTRVELFQNWKEAIEAIDFEMPWFKQWPYVACCHASVVCNKQFWSIFQLPQRNCNC